MTGVCFCVVRWQVEGVVSTSSTYQSLSVIMMILCISFAFVWLSVVGKTMVSTAMAMSARAKPSVTAHGSASSVAGHVQLSPVGVRSSSLKQRPPSPPSEVMNPLADIASGTQPTRTTRGRRSVVHLIRSRIVQRSNVPAGVVDPATVAQDAKEASLPGSSEVAMGTGSNAVAEEGVVATPRGHDRDFMAFARVNPLFARVLSRK
jgi:hypothetical protein